MKRRPRSESAQFRRDFALAHLGGPSPDEIWLDRVVDEHIKRVVVAADGILSLAAELLGVNRRMLQRYARRERVVGAGATRR
jgi:ActR/RegA family two-component response regulator